MRFVPHTLIIEPKEDHMAACQDHLYNDCLLYTSGTFIIVFMIGYIREIFQTK